MILVLLASAAHYKLFKYSFHPLNLELIKNEENLGMRQQKGKFINIHENSEQIHHAPYASTHHFREVSIDQFAQNIIKELHHESIKYKGCKIIIISGPHMYGLLNKHFDDNLDKKVVKIFQKDLLHLNHKELIEYLLAHKFD